MKGKKWFYLFLGQSFLLFCILAVITYQQFSIPEVKMADLSHYIGQSTDFEYLSEEGYIPDAKTAKKFGSQIIDNVRGAHAFSISIVTVEYDETNKLWKVDKGYFPNNGGTVVFKQDTGEVVAFYLWK